MSGAGNVLGLATGWALLVVVAASARAEDSSQCQLKLEGHSIEKLILEVEGRPERHISDPGDSVTLPAGRYRVRQVHLEGGCRADGLLDEEWFDVVAGQPCELVVGAQPEFDPCVEAARRHGVAPRRVYEAAAAAAWVAFEDVALEET